MIGWWNRSRGAAKSSRSAAKFKSSRGKGHQACRRAAVETLENRVLFSILFGANTNTVNEGQAAGSTQYLATISETQANLTASGFTVEVDYGDRTGPVNEVPVSLAGGLFGIPVNHIYDSTTSPPGENPSPFIYNPRIQISDTLGNSALITTDVVIVSRLIDGNEAGTFDAKPSYGRLGSGSTVYTVGTLVFDYTGEDPVTPVTGLSATIDWGDGSSAAADINGTDPSYRLAGTHTYAVSTHAYNVHVTVTDSSSYSFIINSILGAPTTPTNLTATASSDGVATVSWTGSTAPAGIGGYYLYRRDSFDTGGDWTLVGASTTTSLTDTMPANGGNYSVVSYDVNNAVSTPLSFIGNIPEIQSPHVVPTRLQTAITPGINATNTSYVTLTWDPIPGATGYTIYQATSISDDPTYYAMVTGGSNTVYTDYGDPSDPSHPGLAAGAYFYQVSANYPTFSSNLSAKTIVAALNRAGAPTAPTTLVAIVPKNLGNTSSTLNLSWGDQGASDQFSLQQSTDLNTWMNVPGLSTWNSTNAGTYDSFTAVETVSFAVERKYFYRVRTKNASGSSPSSNIASPEWAAQDSVVQLYTSFGGTLLVWDANPATQAYTIYRRLAGATSWGDPYAIIDGSATFWSITNASNGVAYEYQVQRLYTGADGNPHTAVGFIDIGLNLPVVNSRGAAELIVDNSFINSTGTLDSNLSTGLDSEIARLQQDLVGDGWKVLTHFVSESASASSVKSLIAGDYDSSLNTVFLIGHIAVPYAGNVQPDGHPDHVGPWPSDGYYGDLSGTWTPLTGTPTFSDGGGSWTTADEGNTSTNDVIPTNSLGQAVQLAVGRVDMSNLPSFTPTGATSAQQKQMEEQLLRQYFDKDHEYRMGLMGPIQQTAQVMNAFGTYAGAVRGTSNIWSTFSNFVSTNINTIPFNNWFNYLGGQPSLWGYGAGQGDSGGDNLESVAKTEGFAGNPPDGDTGAGASNAIFNMLYGSYVGDWNLQDNLMRGMLANSGDSLTVSWGDGSWMYQPMAIGGTTGQAALLTENTTPNVHIGLLGDPTLTAYVVPPVSNVVSSAKSGGGRTVRWNLSSDSGISGYNVYSASNSSSPFSFTPLNGSLIANPASGLIQSFGDSSGTSATVYMVRAVKLESSGGGSFQAASDGVFSNQPRASVTNQGAGIYLGYGTEGSYLPSSNTLQAGDTATVIGGSVVAVGGNRVWSQGANNTLLVHVNIADGSAHNVWFDLLSNNGNAASAQLTIIDAKTGIVLDSESISGLTVDDYSGWTVQGDVILKISSASNIALGGVFVDPAE